LAWEVVVDGLSSPIQALAPPGETRLLIAQQGGTVLSYENDTVATFLDIEDEVLFGGERGLLSIAIHPGYPDDRRLFAWYTGDGGDTHLVEYDIAPDLQSASSPRTILTVDQPFANHNGGYISFGADGYLYLGLGDGGSGNDPGSRARDLGTLLGKMIRIDVDGSEPYEVPSDNPYVGEPGRDEIWASGLRNPWRWSFDGGYMFIGDVGQGAREEIDLVEVAPNGYDFGWARFEGSLCNPNDGDQSCSTSGLSFPVAEYGRSMGRTVTGGVVYRGPMVRSLDQFYVYADVFSGRIWAFRQIDGEPLSEVELSDEIGMTGIVDFARDGQGELLAVSLFSNSIYRLTGG
jgi:glucose/arabinose dehydrogenase